MYVKSQLSSSKRFRDTTGSKIYTRGAAPHTRYLAKKISYPKSALDLSKCVQISTF